MNKTRLNTSIGALTLLATLVAGCMETRVVNTSWDGRGRQPEPRPDGVDRKPLDLRANYAGAIKELDLRTAPREAVYTLQIGFYHNPDNRTEQRRTAEQAAADLRKKGEQAYYYHGVDKSMVTIGAFGENEVKRVVERQRDKKTGQWRTVTYNRMSPKVEKIQRSYPHNLANGKPIHARRANGSFYTYPPGHAKAGQRQPQASFLVRIPRATPSQARGSGR